MHNFKMNINEYLPLRDVVFYTLRQAILKGELEPGERLMEMQLAEQLGVSRTPIREAIRKLELERLSTELACDRIKDETIQELRQAQEAFKEALDGEDITLQAQRDVEFHDVIYKATGNLRLIQMLNNLREQMYRYRLEYLKYDLAHQTLIEEHEAIIESISKRDKEKATHIIVRHIYNQELTVLKKIQTDEEAPEKK